MVNIQAESVQIGGLSLHWLPNQ